MTVALSRMRKIWRSIFEEGLKSKLGCVQGSRGYRSIFTRMAAVEQIVISGNPSIKQRLKKLHILTKTLYEWIEARVFNLERV
jgi:hypothetical protein